MSQEMHVFPLFFYRGKIEIYSSFGIQIKWQIENNDQSFLHLFSLTHENLTK